MLKLDLNKTEDKKKWEELNLKKFFGENSTVIEALSNRSELYNSSIPKDRVKYKMAYDTVQGLIKEKFDKLSEMILERRIPEQSLVCLYRCHDLNFHLLHKRNKLYFLIVVLNQMDI